MNIRWLLHRNIRYFARYYRLVAMAVVITVAVIVGSLVVGDSVRMTLVRRVTERLGNTETIIFSRSSFISDSILSVSLLGESARGVLLTDGFISGMVSWFLYLYGVSMIFRYRKVRPKSTRLCRRNSDWRLRKI